MNDVRLSLTLVLMVASLAACFSPREAIFSAAIQGGFYEPPDAASKKLPLKVSIVADDSFRSLRLKGETEALIGPLDIALNPGLLDAITAQLNALFERVTVVDKVGEAKDSDLAVIPSVGIAYGYKQTRPINVRLSFIDPGSGKLVSEYEDSGFIDWSPQGLPASEYYGSAVIAGLSGTLLEPPMAYWAQNVLGKDAIERSQVAIAKSLASIAEKIRNDQDFFVGSVLFTKGDLDGAIREYREALRRDPNLALVHYNLGAVFAKKGDLNGAIQEYREALRLDPNRAGAHSTLGAMLGITGDLDGAIKEYREALRLDPNDVEAHTGLGEMLAMKGDLDGAIQECREALRLDPNNATAHYDLGNAFGRKGDRDGATHEYNEVLRLTPEGR